MAELILPAPHVFVSSGGGIRIGASFGAEAQGEALGVFSPSNFDYFLGTSAGALDAALTANGWTAQQKISLFLDTQFSTLFAPAFVPFGLRKALALKWPISLKRLAHFMDELGLTHTERLVINAVDAQTNAHLIYCEKRPPWLSDEAQVTVVEDAFSREGLGTILTRSMALPGLNADHARYRDGGFAENPLLSVLPNNITGVLVSLGYPGLIIKDGKPWPDSIIEQAFYAVDRKGAAFAQFLTQQRPGIKVIDPKVYDVDSSAFGLSRTAKIDMVQRGFETSRPQWLA